MKQLLFISLLSASSLCAQQSFPFVLDTTFDLPASYETGIGKSFTRCMVMLDDTTRHFKFTLAPPQYENVQVVVSEEYAYYGLDHDAQLPMGRKGETVRIVPPKYTMDSHRIHLKNNNTMLIERKNATCLYFPPRFCLFVAIVEVPQFYTHYENHRLVEAAKIEYRNGENIRYEVLDSTSDFLSRYGMPTIYTRVPVYDVRKQRYKVEADFDFLKYADVKQDTGKRQPFLSEWRDIVCCYERITSPTVADIQMALIQRGYLRKQNDVMDRRTKKALARFQRDKGLPVGTLNAETLKSLGLYSN